ncbi:hypothetical protein [Paracoccus ravus]|uniref:hypothetical protein n=1 Tax=Paracoccus ravus TaxID=2447760 RepID=UPI00106EFA7E|nr:hypothetical protein [Paracoccus ravus]
MDRGNILAHRGLWSSPEDKNTRAALQAALELGFGLETDLRDSAEQIYVSHDPVSAQGTLTAKELFSDYAALGVTGRLALNVKADGLQRQIIAELHAAGIPISRVFAFDMSVPDALGYLKIGLPTYTRVSEHESAPSFLDSAAGVWVDNFLGDFPQIAAARRYLDAGHRVALVSPELHGRPHKPLWQAVRDASLHRHPAFEICTDFPNDACVFFEVE